MSNIDTHPLTEAEVESWLAEGIITPAFLVASVWLQRRIFLAFGALSFHLYIFYLVYKTFYSSANFALILALVGVLIILSTAFYQRYVDPWLKAHLSQYGALA